MSDSQHWTITTLERNTEPAANFIARNAQVHKMFGAHYSEKNNLKYLGEYHRIAYTQI